MRKGALYFVLILFFLGLVNAADNLDFGINALLNSHSLDVYIQTNSDAVSGYDGYDLKNPGKVDGGFFVSVLPVTGEDLTVDAWENEDSIRDIYLYFSADSDYTGTLTLSWSSSDLGTQYYFTLQSCSASWASCYDLVNMRTSASASISSSTTKNYFKIKAVHYFCGDGIINATLSEQCDGANLNEQTCASQNRIAGNLSCYASCSFNFEDCTTSNPPEPPASGNNTPSDVPSQGGSSPSGGSSTGAFNTSKICIDECRIGIPERACVTKTSYKFRECGNFDADNCTDYGVFTNMDCSFGEKCLGGFCIGLNKQTELELCNSLGYQCGNYTESEVFFSCGVCKDGFNCITGLCIESKQEFKLSFFDWLMIRLDLKNLWRLVR